MTFSDLVLFQKNPSLITTIDSHTEGEATRLIVAGPGKVPGTTMMEKLENFRSAHDNIRGLLTREPRGSREILAALVTENVTPKAGFGLVYMDAKRYPYLCGHATMGAIVTLADMGFLTLDQGENQVLVDTPSGVMTAVAQVQKRDVISVAINMVPSFVYAEDQEIEVEGHGTVWVDLVCTGGFFAMVDADRLGIAPVLENKTRLVDLGMKIIDAANAQLKVSHPLRRDVTTVDVTEFYTSDHTGPEPWGRGVVVYGESHMDRSPCGTGTAAKMALLHHKGKINMEQPYKNLSPLDTVFEAELKEKTRIGDYEATITCIKGRAWITGLHHFVLDARDPIQKGYLI